MQYDAVFPPKDFFCLNWKNLRGGWWRVCVFIFLIQRYNPAWDSASQPQRFSQQTDSICACLTPSNVQGSNSVGNHFRHGVSLHSSTSSFCWTDGGRASSHQKYLLELNTTNFSVDVNQESAWQSKPKVDRDTIWRYSGQQIYFL